MFTGLRMPDLLRFAVYGLGASCFVGLGIQAAELQSVPCALIVGGGPDVENNAAQIEGHTRFVASLLPAGSKRIVLFADGKAHAASITYADTSVEADAERALAVLLADHDAEEPALTRPPDLGAPADGPAHLVDFRRSLPKVAVQAAKSSTPLLLYFAGHGTQDETHEQETGYDLWGGDKLTVRTLADELGRLPNHVPVVLVMAQCYSGAFANVLFAHGDPRGTLTERNLVGFFSAQKDREASGCSYATGRADYQDFSSYFFGALAGQDRFGETVTGADYDGNGQVNLHEAFCYALIHDPSADTPVCTSDIFLLQQSPLSKEVVYRTPYQTAWDAATPAQRAVLDAFSEQLGLSGENRATTVFDRLTYGDPSTSERRSREQTEARARLNAVRQPALAELFARWPALRWGEREQKNYQEAFNGAVSDLAHDEKLRGSLLVADKVREQADEAVDNEEAALLRFASVYEHVVEARELREHGKPELKARFERLWNAEQGTLALSAKRP